MAISGLDKISALTSRLVHLPVPKFAFSSSNQNYTRIFFSSSQRVSSAAISSSSDYFYWIPMSSSSTVRTEPQLLQTDLPKYVKPSSLGSAERLANWLSVRMPSEDLARWGVEPGTKTLENLWTELVEGEITLQDSSPPKRTVNVASVSIRSLEIPGRYLIESHQQLSDGNIRQRNRPLSEKMKAGETLQEACLRGIAEELGSVLGSSDNVRLLLDSYIRDVQERDSLSYPGLPCCYVLHSLDAVVTGLPTSDFFTDEDDPDHINGCATNVIGVKRHFWKWVSDDDGVL
eukprot:TRINITY_DN37800_c0_g1_i1.p1 TRINITY_DN37800_c0_g1~~TRINITY_DN37800_c0_g1_i1.p1  ORF type:complete len:289 (-),score=45.72 TRINITY_DN37800_c0_g1_i1:207-1073(-)